MAKMQHTESAFFTSSILEPFHKIITNKDFEKLFQIESSPSVSHELNVQNSIESSCNASNSHYSNSAKYKNRGTKVRTIGRIRKQFELEQAEVLPKYLAEIEKCIENYLVGEQVNKLLKSKIETYLLEGAPLNRASFQGISKINLYSFLYKQQYIEVDGKKILLSGSLGGKIGCVKSSSFSDINKKTYLDKPILSNPVRSPGKRKNSLLTYTHPKFKPGPLSKKPRLSCADTVAKIELVAAPAVCLEVYPKIGSKLDSTACFHLGNVLKSNVSITTGWAEFASSLVSHDKSSESCSPSPNAFIIPYENNQNKMLMQKDLDWVERHSDHKETDGGNTPVDASVLDCVMQNLSKFNPKSKIESSVKSLVTDMVNNVCVGQYQDRLWKYDTDYIPFEKSSSESAKKEKIPTKRKYKNELKRLDVTIIDYNEVNETSEKCPLEYCKLGCVCSSLQASCLLKNHCGQPKCMLRCTCSFDRDFTNKSYATEQSSNISNFTVANLQNHLNRYLSKEEKKFRRTVIRSNDQTVAIGACRRGSRVPKKYEDFILPESDIIQETANQKEARVELVRLSECIKLDPLCMVHNLYRCFCKGIFTSGTPYNFSHRADEDSLLSYKSPSPSSLKSDNTLSTLKQVAEIQIPFPTILKSPPVQSASFSLSSNDTESLRYVICSRTSYNEKYIKRSRKKTFKLKEINSRRKRQEESDPALSRLLSMLVSKAFHAQSVDGVDPDPLDLGIPPGAFDQHPKSCLEKSALSNESEAIKSTVPAASTVSLTDSSSLAISTALDRGCLQFLLNNLGLSCQPKVHETLLKPKLGDTSIFSWKIFMHQFLNEAIHVWATLSLPYKLYVTTNPLFSCPVEAVHVSKNISNVENFKGHPSIMQDLLSFDDTINSIVVLVGTSFAWEAVAALQHKSKRDSESATSEHVSENSVDPTDSSSTAHLPEIQSIQGNFTEAKPEDEALSSVLKSFPLSIFKFRWFQLSASNTFDILTVNSKKITMEREKINKAIELSHSSGRIVAVLAQIQLQKHYKQPHFGVYIVPDYKNDILIGPYKMNEVSGIQTLKDHKNPVSEKYHGCWLKDAIKYNTLSAIGGKANPDDHNGSGDDSIETANLNGKVTYLCLSNMSEFSSINHNKKTNTSAKKGAIAKFEHNGIKYSIVKCLKQNGINKMNNILARNTLGTTQKSLLKPLDSSEKISPQKSTEITQVSNSINKLSKARPREAQIEEEKRCFIPESAASEIEYEQVEVLDDNQNGKVVSESKDALSVEEKDKSNEDSEVSDNDDVIFMPAVNEVVEISDSEEDSEIDQKNVWFVCVNIPQLGYIPATLETDSFTTLKFKTLGPVQCTSPIAATIRINNLLKKHVGFIPSSLGSNWKVITCSKEIRHLQPFDEERFNKSHVITEVGFKKRTKKTISTTLGQYFNTFK